MGAVTLCDDFAPETTEVSSLFIDEYMKDANDAELKIYFYLVRQMSIGRATSIQDMADKFNLTEREVVRSLRYWANQGIMSLRTNEAGELAGIRLCEIRPRRDQRVIPISPMLSGMEEKAPEAEHEVNLVPEKKRTPDSRAERKTKKEQEQRAQLIFIVESYIGKPLSVSELKTIYYICDELHFSDDLVDYLFQYCVDSGHKDFRYVEKVAVNWANEGIHTPAQAVAAVAGRAKKSAAAKTGGRSAGTFNSFAQNTYDFAELEKKLLEN